MVEKQDMDHCSVLGGQQMILTGQNFSSDSKVVFMEKTQGEWPGAEGINVISALFCMMQMKMLQLCFPLAFTSALTYMMSLNMSRSASHHGLFYMNLTMETFLHL